jgi:hypothetical protein
MKPQSPFGELLPWAGFRVALHVDEHFRYEDILHVSKKTTLGLFQNAIEISTAEQACLYFSVTHISRNNMTTGPYIFDVVSLS